MNKKPIALCIDVNIYLNMRLWTLEDFGGWMVLGDGQRLLTLTLDVVG